MDRSAGAGEPPHARLEDLLPGASVTGVTTAGPVTVVAVTWHGSQAVTVTYRDGAGRVDERLLYRSDEAALVTHPTTGGWSFDADPELFRLASEALRIEMAYLFDPMLAVHLSRLVPLPHQIQAVYGELLPRQPLRYALCDDPGAGKTIMAGLYIKELALRGDLARCLVVAPGGLVAQWQDELAEKFALEFTILTNAAIEASRTHDPFADTDLMIARLDHLARNDDLRGRLAGSEWDLVVVDEAHRMAAHWFGQEVTETKRYRLGKLLGTVARNLLLMTATPHAGKEEDFQLFLALLDPDRFEGRPRHPASHPASHASDHTAGDAAGPHTAQASALPPLDTSDLMRRMVKENLLTFEGKRLFPERIATTVNYPLSPAERHLYEEVTDYVATEMGRAERLADAGQGRRGNRVGFALTVLQRRLASSPEAIYQSLVRRRHRLQDDLAAATPAPTGTPTPAADKPAPSMPAADKPADPDDYDDLAGDEREVLEDELAAGASTAQSAAELRAEIATLERLETLARAVRAGGEDRKWAEFAALIDDTAEMRRPDGTRRKLIVFTEHRDTLNYLLGRLAARLGRPEAVVAIHGGTRREERRRLQEVFTADPGCVVMVATDAAGEGINLQRAHLLVNYDLPWNPNRLEQRFGRIHRIGQAEVCHMWNLVAADTREGQVYATLLAKLETQRQALGGQVFDVLGGAFEGQPLRDLLIRAVRYGDRPEVRAELERIVDRHVGDGLAELVRRHALSADVLGPADMERLRAEMDEAAARRLQPHHVKAFFTHAFALLGGRLAEREPGRFAVAHVPFELRRPAEMSHHHKATPSTTPVVTRYERVCFDKALVRAEGRPPAELLAPGHPLLDATVAAVARRYGPLLTRGAVLVADTDERTSPWVLVYLEHSVVDGRSDAAGRPLVVSKRFEFVELDLSGDQRANVAAPYLDCRPPSGDERLAIAPLLATEWLAKDLEGMATDVAVTRSVPAHLDEVRRRTTDRVRRVRAAVHARLRREIDHWDRRAIELDQAVAAGRQPRINPERARHRADSLAERLAARMAELDREEQLRALPPVVVGAALVVPAGLLRRLTGVPAPGDAAVPAAPPHHTVSTARVERLAVDAVLAAEARLGRRPTEMAPNNPGFDIRSTDADGHLRFVEVKGRAAGAATVTVTRNEILTGLNTDRWTLALVEVGADDATEVRYLHHPFTGHMDDLGFTETSRTFAWERLWAAAGPPT